MSHVLIQDKTNPAVFTSWSGRAGVPETSAPHVSAATSTIVTVDTSVTVLAANLDRKKFLLQNVSVVPIYVKLGLAASASDYSFVLQGGTADADGKGGTYWDDSYTGAISAVAASGTARKLAVVEL